MKSEIEQETIDLLINKIKREYSYNKKEDIIIEFQGGEPLLYFNKIKYIYKEIKTYFNNVKYILTTNGTLLTEEMLLFFGLNKNISLNISIDGNKEIQEKNRPMLDNKEYFDNILMKNFSKLLEYNININIIGTINKNWVNSDYNKLIKEIRKIKELEQQIGKGKITFFMRPEILLSEKSTYGIDVNKLIIFFKNISKDVGNIFLNIKNDLIEFNEDAHSNTICLDYDGTIFINDYFKSYIKRFKIKEYILYKNLFNIYTLNSLFGIHNIFSSFKKDNMGEMGIKNKKRFEEEIFNNLSGIFNKKDMGNIDYLYKNIFLDYFSKSQNGYFIFGINKETKRTYEGIIKNI